MSFRWNTTKLSNVAYIASGQGAPQLASDFNDVGIPFIRAGSLDPLVKGGNESDCEHITEETAQKYGLKLFTPGTVLFAKSGMSAKLDRIYQLKSDAYVVNHLAAIMPSGDCDSTFLKYWLQANPPSGLIKDDAYPSIRLSDIEEIEIPLPPLDEQRRIAAILDKADAIRRKRQESIHLTEEFLRSTFLEMFGDPVLNPKGWDTVRMEDIIEDGPQNGLYKHESDYGSGTPIVRIDSFYDGEITGLINLKRLRIDQGTIRKYRLRENDILVNRVNSRKFLGKCAIVPKLIEDTVFESNMMRMKLRDERVCPAYVINLFQHPYIKKQIDSRAKDAVNQSSINQDDVKSFELRLPPVALQKKFMQVKTMANKIRARFNDIALVDNRLFNSLVKRAFQGEP